MVAWGIEKEKSVTRALKWQNQALEYTTDNSGTFAGQHIKESTGTLWKTRSRLTEKQMFVHGFDIFF